MLLLETVFIWLDFAHLLNKGRKKQKERHAKSFIAQTSKHTEHWVTQAITDLCGFKPSSQQLFPKASVTEHRQASSQAYLLKSLQWSSNLDVSFDIIYKVKPDSSAAEKVPEHRHTHLCCSSSARQMMEKLCLAHKLNSLWFDFVALMLVWHPRRQALLSLRLSETRELLWLRSQYSRLYR